MEETKTSTEQSLNEKIAGIKKPQLLRKGTLSVFRLFETVDWKSFHFQKYYEQIVNEPIATEEERTKQIVEESAQTVSNQRSKKKRWISSAFLILNLLIVAGILIWSFTTGTQVSIADLLTQKINWIWLFVGILLFLFINWTDGMRIFALIFHVTKKPRAFLSYKSNSMCRFYDNITPLSTGGQPFQIYYLNKHGLSAGIATSVPLAKYLYSQFLSMIFVAIVLVLQHTYIISLNPIFLTLCYIGFGLNVLLLGSILFLSVSKKVGPSCAIGILKLLSKMKIVKDYRKAFVKVMHTVRDYVATMKKFLSNIWVVLVMLVLSLIFFISFYSIPFVVYATFMPLDANWFTVYVELFTIAVVCDMACCFMPIPGATGMAEISFGVLFAGFFDSVGIGVWALLLWRIFTYYGYLIQGLAVMLYDFAIGNKKYEQQKAKFVEPELKVIKNRRKK